MAVLPPVAGSSLIEADGALSPPRLFIHVACDSRLELIRGAVAPNGTISAYSSVTTPNALPSLRWFAGDTAGDSVDWTAPICETQDGMKEDLSMSNQLTQYPVIPLRDTVLFPGVTTQIVVGRPGTVVAVERALEEEEQLVFAVLQRDDDSEVEADRLHSIGVLAQIVQVEQQGKTMQLLVHGERRATGIRFDRTDDGSLLATVNEVESIEPENPESVLLVALTKEIREKASELGRKSGLPVGVLRQALTSVDTLGGLADLVGSYLDIPASEKQTLLETFAVEERLRALLVHLQRRIGVLEAQKDIQEKVQEELGSRQREMVLRQQLKAIQEELGESGEEENVDELRARIDALELTPEVRKEIDREVRRWIGMPSEAMEAQVIRTYLETVAELPWGERSDEQLEVLTAARVLADDHYGLEDVKDRILEHLAVLALRQRRAGDAATSGSDGASAESPVSKKAVSAEAGPEKTVSREVVLDDAELDPPSTPEIVKPSRAPILLFTGPPGVGKTSIAKSIARSMGREYVRISLGGVRDEADIRGHRRTYVGALPGRIIQGMRQAGTRNPVFLLDEVDKLGNSHQGDPSSALLEVLDPAQNDSFVDHYLGVPFDLSEVLFIATANFPQNISAPLMDRMEVVDFSGYTEAEKGEIARRYLIPRQVEDKGLAIDEFPLAESALSRVISNYTREAGVRQLEKQIGKLARKVARRVAEGSAPTLVIDEPLVTELLGRARAQPERASSEDRVGVATGMFYTPVGGDILFVEATTMPGKGNLVLTGQLGDVMQESARAVWSYAKSHAAEFLIRDDMFDRDVHIHVPAGATPKDGPSAGVTLASALISALSGVPVRHDVAMTGEITLTGRVLPIGGVKEKILGGVRAGITEFILPKENAEDLQDLPESVRDSIRVQTVESLDEVLELALRGGVFRSDSMTL